MYFISQKNKWYSRIVHSRPIYRYGVLLSVSAVIFFGWRYGLYSWLQAAIQQEQATLFRLQHQIMQQPSIERKNSTILEQLPLLKKKHSAFIDQCNGTDCYDQCSYLFELANKANVQVMGYQSEKEKGNTWKKSQFIVMTVVGTLDQIQQFFMLLKESGRLIQCTALSLQKNEGLFTAHCTIQFISMLSSETV